MYQLKNSIKLQVYYTSIGTTLETNNYNKLLTINCWL